MGDLFPFRSDTSPSADRKTNIVSIDDKAGEEIFDVLSSNTTRKVLTMLYDEPRTAKELADGVETSLQNVQYHLTKLEEAELIEIVDTWYSERGTDMKVYAPTDESIVIFAGNTQEKETLRKRLSRLLSVVGVIAVGGIIVEHLVIVLSWTSAESEQWVLEPVIGPSIRMTPGVLFFIGGVFALIVLIAVYNESSR